MCSTAPKVRLDAAAPSGYDSHARPPEAPNGGRDGPAGHMSTPDPVAPAGCPVPYGFLCWNERTGDTLDEWPSGR
jgi:hypothetical protein